MWPVKGQCEGLVHMLPELAILASAKVNVAPGLQSTKAILAIKTRSLTKRNVMFSFVPSVILKNLCVD